MRIWVTSCSPLPIPGLKPDRCAAWQMRLPRQCENLLRIRRSLRWHQNCGPSNSLGGAAMKFWIGPIGGALIAGAYGTLRLSEEWNIGGEHAFRASGTLLAYMLVGSFIGLVISGLVFAATQDDDSVPEPMPGDVRRVLMERSRPMSHPVCDKTKVLDR